MGQKKEFFSKKTDQKLIICRSSDRRCSIKKSALKTFANFTGKHLCQNPFFDKVAGHLWETASASVRVYSDHMKFEWSHSFAMKK